MKQDSRRTTLALVFIVGAACFGVSSIILAPMHEELGRTRAQISAAQSRLAQAAAQSPAEPDWNAAIERYTTMKASIDALNEPARDAASLHRRVTALAQECGIEINRMEPRSHTAQPGSVRSQSGSPVAAPSRTIGLSIHAHGSYESVAEFARRIDTECGFAKTVRVRLTPAHEPGSTRVIAEFETIHIAFDVDPTVSPSSMLVSAQEGS